MPSTFGTRFLRRRVERDAFAVSRSYTASTLSSPFVEDLYDIASYLRSATPLQALIASTSLSDRRRYIPSPLGSPRGVFMPAVDVMGSQGYGLEVRPWPKRPLRPDERPYYSPLAPKPVRRATPRKYGKYRVRSMPASVGFSDPWKMVICLKRKLRREVMFALGRTKKGSKAKFHRQSYYTRVRC